MAGILYVVATPIGNLEDITLRALRILRDEVSAIACEDTRQTQKLLSHYEIRKPLISYHEHNELSRTGELLAMLERGESLALVSDAGTPLVSDPGYRVVKAAIDSGVSVVPIPGASALLAALAASGLATDSFLFLGFLPAKSTQRRKRLTSLAGESATLVFYESPHRILETLQDIAELLGERRMVLTRELTKLHEEFLRGTAQEIQEQLAARGTVKGEITFAVERGQTVSAELTDPAEEVKKLATAGVPRMEAIKAVAKRLGLPKREVYQAVEEQGSSPQDKRHGSQDKGR